MRNCFSQRLSRLVSTPPPALAPAPPERGVRAFRSGLEGVPMARKRSILAPTSALRQFHSPVLIAPPFHPMVASRRNGGARSAAAAHSSSLRGHPIAGRTSAHQCAIPRTQYPALRSGVFSPWGVSSASPPIRSMGSPLILITCPPWKKFIASRPTRTRALPILVNSIEQAILLAREIPDNFLRLATAFWPGALTIVLDAAIAYLQGHCQHWPRCSALPAQLCRRRAHRRIRRSHHWNQRELVRASLLLQRRQVQDQLGARLSLILDVGELNASLASTIVVLRGDETWKIVREGSSPTAISENHLS